MWAHLASRALIHATGQDVIAFLQGLVTNDMTKLSTGHPLYACMLTPQGKFLYDFIISQENDAVLIECEAHVREEILKKLKMYKLRNDVNLTPDDRAVFAYWNQKGEGFADPRLADLGGRQYGLAPKEGDEGSEDDYRVHRYVLGVPEGQRELPPQKAILLENNLDDLHAISWDKGCYMGQELTARTKYRGLVRKKLFPIQGEDLAKDSAIEQDGKQVGTVMAAMDGKGLALIRLEALQNATPLCISNNEIRYHVPGWMTVEEPS